MMHGSLFSGIGGFDLAAEWMGWDNVFHCEIAEFPRKILNYYWPNAKTHEDITKTDFTIYRGTIDILSGGFPCQPFSAAGKRLGTEDSRHLWPEMLRAIREIKPRWIVGENVAGFITWNDGMVFREVCADLENEGYEVQAFVIPACATGAPHRRDRVWIIANCDSCTKRTYRTSTEIKRNWRKNIIQQKKWGITTQFNFGFSNVLWTPSDTMYKRLQRGQKINRRQKYYTKRSRIRINFGTKCKNFNKSTICNFKNFPTQSPICSGDDGLPRKMDGITFSKWRNESIKGYGNAVVPQVVYKIFQAIQTIENEKTDK